MKPRLLCPGDLGLAIAQRDSKDVQFSFAAYAAVSAALHRPERPGSSSGKAPALTAAYSGFLRRVLCPAATMFIFSVIA